MVKEKKTYYVCGQLAYHYYEKDNKKHGEFKRYDDGQLEIHCFYKNNHLHGERKEYYKDGKLCRHAIYANNYQLDINPSTLSNEDKVVLKMKYDIEFLPE